LVWSTISRGIWTASPMLIIPLPFCSSLSFSWLAFLGP
jgi:hypothetical protein